MNAVSSLSPFDLLRDIEHRSQTRALGLPQQIEVRRTWSGIGFRLGEAHLVSPMGHISEILEYPNLTRIPSAHSWVKGIANVRGSLLPVLDLSGFLGGEITKVHRRSRVLIIQSDDLSCGLMVDEVYGLRHFFEEEKLKDTSNLDTLVWSFLDGGYQQGGVDWGVFNMHDLIENPKFKEVSARK